MSRAGAAGGVMRAAGFGVYAAGPSSTWAAVAGWRPRRAGQSSSGYRRPIGPKRRHRSLVVLGGRRLFQPECNTDLFVAWANLGEPIDMALLPVGAGAERSVRGLQSRPTPGGGTHALRLIRPRAAGPDPCGATYSGRRPGSYLPGGWSTSGNVVEYASELRPM